MPVVSGTRCTMSLDGLGPWGGDLHVAMRYNIIKNTTILLILLLIVVGGFGFGLLVVGWRRALRSEWPFTIYIGLYKVGLPRRYALVGT